MATQTLRVTGELGASPTLGASSGVPGTVVPLDESIQLAQMHQCTLFLGADSPVDVPFGTMTSGNFLFVKSTGRVRVRITSADGVQQALPVDGVLLQFSESAGLTAVDVTRVAGQDTTVDVLIGQKVS